MTPRGRKSPWPTGTIVVVAIAIVAVIAAWQVGRRSERRAAEARSADAQRQAPAAAATATNATDAAPKPAETMESAAGGEPAAPMESSATYEMPVAPEPSTPAPLPRDERPVDTPARCLLLQASPSMASAYGRSGQVVQLVVRAQNGCATSFGYASFRVVATGADGREAGSAVGSFPGGVSAGGSAETLVAIPTTPSTSLSYRAEVR